jgi:CDP-glucose 4,6-dehydratase
MEKRQRTLENLVVNKFFWKNRKVFLTGHTGFKGSWLSLWLQYLGADLTGYSLKPPTTPSLFELANVKKNMRSIIGDIRDLVRLKKYLNESKAEILIHMAAQPIVRYSYLNPVETYSTNVMGTVNILEAARENFKTKAILIVTSDKCYENKEIDKEYREHEPLGGYDPYSNSKGCSELVVSAYRNSFFNVKKYKEHGVGLATGRAGNVIGGGDWAVDRLIPDIMQAFIKKKTVIIRNPKAIRPWQHVLEPLRGYLMLSEKLYKNGSFFSESFNFGPEKKDAKPVKWVIDKLAKLWNTNASWSLDKNINPHEAHYLKLDITKAKKKLNWKPYWSLNTALVEIVDWYQFCSKIKFNNTQVQNKCIEQIKKYSNLGKKFF